MNKLREALRVSFSAKVLLPVALIMILLLVVTASILNGRITRQFQAEASRSLATADAVFRNSHKIHTKYLVLRFRNLPNEPRYRAALQSGHVPTLREQIKDLPADQGVDVALFASAQGEVLAAARRDPLIALNDFETNSAAAVRQALRNEDIIVDTIRVGERLFDAVSIPVFGNGGELIGALALGTEIADSAAQEFSMVTHSQIVLLANGRVIASTVAGPEPAEHLGSLFRECTSPVVKPGGASHKQILLGDEHYFCSAGQFSSLRGDSTLGYLLLTSYEQPLRALRETQAILLLVSVLGILLSTTIVWYFIRRVTAPLRALRNSAEAVGQGDFSKRVEVTSRDECGELALVFNRMTESLKVSREQLEKSVHTLKTTQAQLVQSEKLSGIGEFVAGVAHELNNPLTSVMGFSELLKRADTRPEHQRHLDLILQSAMRCQKIVQNLLSFARRHPPERKLSSVNSLIEGTIDFLQYQLRTSNIEVITRLDRDLPKLMVDPHQLQQVFLNLINNARQAVEAHQPSGKISVTSETCGQRIRLTFQDDGPGIAEENLSKVFDPFFTTKEAGKGTGLGLSLCYGIISEHGGTISVRSKPGQGATFIIELPLTQPEPPATATDPSGGEHDAESSMARAATASPPGGLGRGKRVLVIDDEDSILQMVSETLTDHGFEVDVARDGASALERLLQIPYDLALCDWKMPGLNGRQVYERLHASNPGLSERLIFITGDVISDRTQKFLSERKKICLSKPFSLAEFRVAIDRALAGG